MNLEYAVDRLYEVGWVPGARKVLERLEDGRVYPGAAEVERAFEQAGMTLVVRHVGLFNCYRAEWSCGGKTLGYCVGASREEAVVFAYAQLVKERGEGGREEVLSAGWGGEKC